MRSIHEHHSYVLVKLRQTIDKLMDAKDAEERKALRQVAADYAVMVTALE